VFFMSIGVTAVSQAASFCHIFFARLRRLPDNLLGYFPRGSAS
jgi:hypothetical protein